MNLFDYIDQSSLTQQICDGMVKEQSHPSLPLRILNYTQKAQFTPEKWNEVTDKCRGLIFHAETKEIIARPFVKFWNYGDARHPETLPENLPATTPLITKKMDGSLGILYQYDGQWAVATRGSFRSDQAEWATKWLRGGGQFLWPEGYTPLVEIIYPENQIVVKYDWSGLIMLASIRIASGEEVSRPALKRWASENAMRVVDEFDKPLDICVTEDIENEEGYVASWVRPGIWPLRVKIKMDTYRRLHRLMTQTNPVTVWEMLRDGVDMEALSTEAPMDFVSWINGIENQLRSAYRTIEQAALSAMLEYDGEKSVSTPEQRKEFAMYATGKQPLTPVLFSMLDRKDYAPVIWKMVRPRGNETFKVDDE